MKPTDQVLWFDKQPVSAKWFLKRQTVTRSITDQNTQLFIGHCRFSTHGDATKNENNHPHFSRDGRLAIVHNGVIWCHDWLSRDEHLEPSKSECDSEVIAHLLQSRFEAAPTSKTVRKQGILDVTETLDDYQGDFAVAALDRDSRCIWLFRNHSNPLHYVRIPLLGITLFASEAGHLHAAVCAVLNKRSRRRWGYRRQNIMSLTAGQAGIIQRDGSMRFSRRVAPIDTPSNTPRGHGYYGPSRSYTQTMVDGIVQSSPHKRPKYRSEEELWAEFGGGGCG